MPVPCSQQERTDHLEGVVTRNRDRHIADKWISEDAVPTADENRRIEFALEQLELVANASNEHIARNWMLGANVGDEGIAPWQAIRSDNFTGVVESAKSFVSKCR